MRRLNDDSVYNRFNSIKVLYYSDKLKEIVNGSYLPFPVIWHVYPTNKCPHNCSFCIMKEDRIGQEQLSKETLLKAVKTAKTTSEAIHFSGGGDPLMHPNILEALKEAKSLTRIMSTNGVFLTNEIVENVESIRISVNAGSKESHEKLMGAKTWSKIWKNIEAIEDKSKVGLGFVLTDENWHEVYQFCEFANRYGVNFVHIRPAYLPEKDDRIQALLPAVKGLTDQAKKDFPNLNIYSVKDKFDGYWTERKYKKCLATPMNAVLKANGKFILCQDRLDTEFGDYDKRDFTDIWGSEEHLKMIESINCDECPRCVMTKVNEYIEHIFIDNNVKREII